MPTTTNSPMPEQGQFQAVLNQLRICNWAIALSAQLSIWHAGTCSVCGPRTPSCRQEGSRSRAAGLQWGSLKHLPPYTAMRLSTRHTLCASCQPAALTTGWGPCVRHEHVGDREIGLNVKTVPSRKFKHLPGIRRS